MWCAMTEYYTLVVSSPDTAGHLISENRNLTSENKAPKIKPGRRCICAQMCVLASVYILSLLNEAWHIFE